jgi:cold shock CspA family protein
LADGQEIYFHRNSVADHGFEKLRIGAAVTLVLSEGDAGPQASLVRPVHQGFGA